MADQPQSPPASHLAWNAAGQSEQDQRYEQQQHDHHYAQPSQQPAGFPQSGTSVPLSTAPRPLPPVPTRPLTMMPVPMPMPHAAPASPQMPPMTAMPIHTAGCSMPSAYSPIVPDLSTMPGVPAASPTTTEAMGSPSLANTSFASMPMPQHLGDTRPTISTFQQVAMPSSASSQSHAGFFTQQPVGSLASLPSVASPVLPSSPSHLPAPSPTHNTQLSHQFASSVSLSPLLPPASQSALSVESSAAAHQHEAIPLTTLPSPPPLPSPLPSPQPPMQKPPSSQSNTAPLSANNQLDFEEFAHFFQRGAQPLPLPGLDAHLKILYECPPKLPELKDLPPPPKRPI
ncbi:hypothetical protein THASP1DRAFT_29092, partial [Thamnocephalis sphaerospora]